MIMDNNIDNLLCTENMLLASDMMDTETEENKDLSPSSPESTPPTKDDIKEDIKEEIKEEKMETDQEDKQPETEKPKKKVEKMDVEEMRNSMYLFSDLFFR